jgi:hypothetical protein
MRRRKTTTKRQMIKQRWREIVVRTTMQHQTLQLPLVIQLKSTSDTNR